MNVGGMQAQTPRPPQPDSDVSEDEEGPVAGGDEPEDKPKAGPPETGWYLTISNSYPNNDTFITFNVSIYNLFVSSI